MSGMRIEKEETLYESESKSYWPFFNVCLKLFSNYAIRIEQEMENELHLTERAIARRNLTEEKSKDLLKIKNVINKAFKNFSKNENKVKVSLDENNQFKFEKIQGNRAAGLPSEERAKKA